MRFETELVALIKEKKELSSLSNSFVHSILLRTAASFSLSKLDSYSSFEKFKRSSLCKQLVTLSRKHLRDVYGLFVKQAVVTWQKKVSQITSSDNPLITDILTYHQSTAERLDDYPVVFELIFSTLTTMGFPKKYSLMDLACGFNPFSYFFLPVKPESYLAVDLSPVDMSVINQFFMQTKISGKAFAFDILSEEFSTWLSTVSVDLCFLFKALDSFERAQRNSSKRLISKINASFFVVSFALSTIGGRALISEKKRFWFEKFCKTNNWPLKTIQTANELFYIVNKKSI